MNCSKKVQVTPRTKMLSRSQKKITPTRDMRRVMLFCLYVSILVLVDANDRVVNGSNSTQMFRAPAEVSNATGSGHTQQVELLATAPSVTSVHKVWTSTSRGSLNDLSPEMIGKLRNDMPFLSAYALRPRLVGGPQVASEELSAVMANQRSARAPRAQDQSGQLDSSATSLTSKRITGDSLVPRLGDFNEFKVETSSTSKSEHHHKRSTSLKRKPNGSSTSGTSKGKLSRRSLSRVKKSPRSANKVRGLSAKGRKNSARRASRSLRGTTSRRRLSSRKKLIKARNKRKRARSSLPQRINIIRHGRYIQEQSIGANNDSNELDVDMRAVGRDTTTATMLSGTGTKTNEAGTTKGGDSSGTASGARKRPFYESARPTMAPEAEDAMNNVDGNDLNKPDSAEKTDRTSIDAVDEDSRSTDEPELDATLDDDVADEPKRVGDPDVEEDGDTVLVEPKSDGVDDDPPIESAEDDEPTSVSSDGEKGDGSPGLDTGGRRKGREQPRDREDDSGRDDAVDENSGETGSTGFSGGGGIGATVGGSNGSPSVGAGEGSKADDRDDDNDNSGSDDDRPAEGRRARPIPGVEFADENSSGAGSGGSNDSDLPVVGEGERDDGSISRGSTGSGTSSEGGPGVGLGGDRDDDGEDGRRTSLGDRGTSTNAGKTDEKRLDDSDLDYESEKDAEIERKDARGSRRDQDADEDDDLDYRDELDGTTNGGRSRPNDERKSILPDANEKNEGNQESHRRGGKRGHKEVDCEDKDHGHDHHGDDHHHHHHGIEWLRGAIPGEPGQDYPILSRANTTDFSCRDQKHPGYYADVESRCQVSGRLSKHVSRLGVVYD